MEYLSDDKAAKDIRIFKQKDIIVGESQKRCYEPFFNGLKREFGASNRYHGVKLALSALLGGAVYLFVGLKALSGTVGIGNVVLAYGGVTKLILSLGELSQIATDLRNNNAHLERYFNYMDTPDSAEQGDEAVDMKMPIIRFEKVGFRYPGSDEYALKELTLEIAPGERLAVVGMNGSGKTTMIKLLCRLYAPTEGRITLNGRDISDYRSDEYIRLFSVVFQDFSLLAFALGQNVAAAAEYNAARVRECLDLAGFSERLSRLGLGLEQPLYRDYDEAGVDLSGGEAQKIAIARAVYKNAAVVILDEPTAALDPASEYEIYSKFNAIVGDRTAVYISHRLSSCRFCDKIAVFKAGRLVEYGAHDALLRRADGEYTALWNAQAQYYNNTAAI
jgi:ATP-binding cassette subfamily B protein